MNRKHIIFACKGNIGRSPVAELVGNQYLETVGAQNHYIISSRGTATQAILEGLRSPQEMEVSMNIFTTSGLHHASFDAYRAAVLSGNSKDIQRYGKEAMDHCIESEMNKRDAILQGLDIRGASKRNPEQMIAQENIDYIFAVDRKVYDEAYQIYSGQSSLPTIHVLSVFATGNQGEKDSEVDLRDPEKVWKSYRESLERIVEHTPLALGRIIGL